MHAFDQRVECAARAQRRPAAATSSAASSPTPSITSSRAAPRPREIARDQLEFTERHAGPHARTGSPRPRRRSAAAMHARRRSSTALTNLWPSVAPKRFASSTAFVDDDPVRHVGTRHAAPRGRARGPRARRDRAAPARCPSDGASSSSSASRRRADGGEQRREVLADRRARSRRRRAYWCDELRPGAGALSCHWYSACSSSLRASAARPRRIVGAASPRQTAQLAQQVGELERRQRRIGALVAGLAAGALHRPARSCRSSARRRRPARRSRSRRARARGAFAGDEVEVRVSPRITAPSATIASQRPACRERRATSGRSKAPGTRTSSSLPRRRRRDAAARRPRRRIRRSTIASLKRAATIAMRRSRAGQVALEWCGCCPCRGIVGRSLSPRTRRPRGRTPRCRASASARDSTRMRVTPRSCRICAPMP